MKRYAMAALRGLEFVGLALVGISLLFVVVGTVALLIKAFGFLGYLAIVITVAAFATGVISYIAEH